MKSFKALIIIFFFSIANIVSAHDITNNGTATMLVHIEPGHMAMVGKPVTIYIDLKNSEEGFAIEKCDCVFNIEKEEKTIFSANLTPALKLNEFDLEGIPFTFPEIGEYHLVVKANPKSGFLFTPFEIEEHQEVIPSDIDSDINMASVSETPAPDASDLPWFAVPVLVAAGFIFSIYNYKKSKKVN